jgi:mannose-6-phosphate isomerase-like protein (cupin superfamily)
VCNARLIAKGAIYEGCDRDSATRASPGCFVAQTPAAQKSTPGGYIVERDSEVQSTQPGPHNGGGETIAYSFFAKTPRLALVFRKRALKPGSAIGYHEQTEDEIYYVLSGRGMMTADGKTFEVGPGDCVLTRTGSSHGLKQIGSEDLVILIDYEQKVQ